MVFFVHMRDEVVVLMLGFSAFCAHVASLFLVPSLASPVKETASEAYRQCRADKDDQNR